MAQKTDNEQGGTIMAGLNQQGPMNEGPMTGRSRGLCANNVQSGQGRGQMMGMGRGRGRCQLGGRGMGFNQQFDQPPQQSTAPESALQNRVNTLEAELLELKKQLQNS